MLRRANRQLLTPLALATAVLAAVPAGALASTPPAAPGSGGVGYGAGGQSAASSSSAAPAAAAQPANVTVSASGDGITVQTDESGLLSRRVTFSGTAPSSGAGDVVEIERSATGAPGSWLSTAQATIQPGGAFTVRWRANQPGHLAIQAVLVPASATAASARTTTRAHGAAATSGPTPATAPSGPSTQPLAITVYRPSLATFYGPGFYGNETACGTTLRKSTLGVASRTLKCGTKVAIYYGGRSIVVPVIDRGPYANSANWDLTMATAQALGMTETETIGALAVS